MATKSNKVINKPQDVLMNKMNCGPCRVKDKMSSTKATYYCMNCDDFFCNDCKASHQTFKGTLNHTVIPSDKAPDRREMIQTLKKKDECKTHGKMLDVYCPSHEAFCCGLCVAEVHIKCLDMSSLEKHREKLYQQAPNLENTLKELKKDGENLITLDGKYLKEVARIKESIMAQFDILRDRVLDILDQAEETAKEKIERILEEESRKIAAHRKECKELVNDINTWINTLDVSNSHCTEPQKIITEHELINKAKDGRRHMTVLRNLAWEMISMELKFSDTKLSQMKEDESIIKVVVHGLSTKKRQSDASSIATSRTGGSKIRPFSKRNAKFQKIFYVQTPTDKKQPNITGSVFLPDSRLILIDRENSKLKVFYVGFKFLSEKTFTEHPRTVTARDMSDEVAVTFPEKRKIRRLAVEKQFEEKGIITTKFVCLDAVYLTGDQLIIVGEPDVFAIFSAEGSELRRVTGDSEGNPLFTSPRWVSLDKAKRRAFVSNGEGDEVTAIDIKADDAVVFRYVHESLRCPEAVTPDHEGNVYVCGSLSHNLHQIAPDGKLITKILSRTDKIDYPQTMSFNAVGDTFIVSRLNTDFVKVYRML